MWIFCSRTSLLKVSSPGTFLRKSFGPNCRRFNACVGSLPAQKHYAQDLFPPTLPPLEWKDEAGQHALKEDIFLTTTFLARVGCLTGKNIFQIARRCTAFHHFKAAAGNARHHGRKAPIATRVRNILQVMKINDEPYEHCSRILGEVLTGQTLEQAEMKAYVIARTYSRLAAESSALTEQMDRHTPRCGSFAQGRHC